jgi:hypothetical protein
MIVVKSEELQVAKGVWDGSTRSYKTEYHPRQVISAEQINEVKSVINELKVRSLRGDEKSIYFDPSAEFPRKKFKEYYPSIPIKSYKNASCIVVDIRELKGWVSRLYCYEYENDGTGWGRRLTGTSPKITLHCNPFYNYDNERDKRTIGNVVKRLNFIIALTGKDLVDVSSLTVKTDNHLDDEAFDNIDQMLESPTADMNMMALRMLTAYDYQKYKARIAVLLNNRVTRIKRRGGNASSSIEIKYMLNKLKEDYPHYEWTGASFWLLMAADNPDDVKIQGKFLQWLSHYNDCPPLKVERIYDRETENNR